MHGGSTITMRRMKLRRYDGEIWVSWAAWPAEQRFGAITTFADTLGVILG